MVHSPAARRGLGVGSVVGDMYTVEELIGRGGMGEVYLASHNRLPGKRVAIKVLHAELSEPDVIARFKREGQIASQLAHPNIVDVDDFNVTPEGVPYLVLEYLVGESLASRIKRGPLPLEQVLTFTRQVGSALAAAHRADIIHRDLKPQNIYLVATERDGRAVDVAKVLDFGISKMLGSQTVKTQESALLGTPQYMAPEQALGHHSTVDERTDVFAFGTIVYEMLAGHPPFSGASIPEVVFKVVYEQPIPLATAAPDVPAAIVAAVEKAMAKKADERHPTVNAFVEALTGEGLGRALPDGGRITDPPPLAQGSHRGTAYAATVDSGPGVAKTKAPEPVSGHAATIASQNEPRVRGSAPTVGDTVARPVAPTSRRGLGLAIGLVVLGAAAVAAVVLMRGGDDVNAAAPVALEVRTPVHAPDPAPTPPAPAPTPPAPILTPTPPAPTSPTSIPTVVHTATVDDAAQKVVENATRDMAADEAAQKAAIAKQTKPKKSVAGDDTAPAQPAVNKKFDGFLASAVELLMNNKASLAIQQARKITNNPGQATEAQLDNANWVIAMGYCQHLNDYSQGRPFAQAMRPSLRKRQALKECRGGRRGD